MNSWMAGAASNLLEGLAEYGGLNKTPYGGIVQQASTFLEGYGRTHGAPSGAGGGMEGPGAYHGTNQQHLSEGLAYGGQGKYQFLFWKVGDFSDLYLWLSKGPCCWFSLCLNWTAQTYRSLCMKTFVVCILENFLSSNLGNSTAF